MESIQAENVFILPKKIVVKQQFVPTLLHLQYTLKECISQNDLIIAATTTTTTKMWR